MGRKSLLRGHRCKIGANQKPRTGPTLDASRYSCLAETTPLSNAQPNVDDMKGSNKIETFNV